jgi:hypothetical protein
MLSGLWTHPVEVAAISCTALKSSWKIRVGQYETNREDVLELKVCEDKLPFAPV